MNTSSIFRRAARRAAPWLLPLALMACSESSGTSTATAGDTASPGVDSSAADDTTGQDTQGADAATSDEDVAAADDTAGSDDTAGADDVVAPAPLLPVFTLSDKAFPESVEFDPTTRRFFSASLELGNVLVTDGVTGTSQEFFAGNGEPGWLGLGLQVDAPRRRLWVCVAHEKTIDYGEVWQLDLDTGERKARLDLSKTAEGGGCTDFALADDGGVYVTDRQHGRIFHVSGGDTPTATVAVDDPELAPAVIGQNGIVIHPNQKVLVSGKYLPIRLMRTDLTDPEKPVVTELPLDTSFLEGGADDLVLFDGKLYAIVEDRVVEVTFGDADWTTAQITDTRPIWMDGEVRVGGFSGIVVAEGSLYASRSDVVLWGFGAELTRPPMIRQIPGIGAAQ